MTNVDDLLGPGYGRVVAARQGLTEAVAAVSEMARDVDDFGPLGTPELPAAVAALAAAEALDEDESGARWVSRAFTAGPADWMGTGWAAIAFCGAVMILRAALDELDQALAAVGEAGPTEPGGTFSA
ncbi:hypothetical protein [Streptomyces sp. NPDC001635]